MIGCIVGCRAVCFVSNRKTDGHPKVLSPHNRDVGSYIFKTGVVGGGQLLENMKKEFGTQYRALCP